MKCHIIGNKLQPVITVPLEQTDKLIAYRDGLAERAKEAELEGDWLRVQITHMKLASIHFDQDIENWTYEIGLDREIQKAEGHSLSEE